MQTIQAWLDTALVHTAKIEVAGLPTHEVREGLESAVTAIYVAMAAGLDLASVQDQCALAVDGTRRALEALQSVETDDASTHGAMAGAAAALGALLRRDFSARTDGEAPRDRALEPPDASVGEPGLIETPRPLVRPAIPLRTEPPPPLEITEVPVQPAPVETLEQLEAMMRETLANLMEGPAEPPQEPPQRPFPTESDESLGACFDEAEAQHFGRPVPPSTQLDVYSEYLHEDLGMLGLMRQHREGTETTWLGRQKPERRLLRKLDGLIACGPERIPRLVRRLDARPLPDPELTWALLFVCGSLAGKDTGDELTRLALAADVTLPEMGASLADVLGIVPHPAAIRLLEGWLDDPTVSRRAIALEALGRRRRLAPERIDQAVESGVVELMRPAMRAAGRAIDPPREGTWLRAVQHEDPEVVELTFQAGLLQRRQSVLDHAISFCMEGRADHGNAVLYAVLGAAEQYAQQALEEALASNGAPIVLEAVGHFGDIAYVPLLLKCLADERGASTAAEALQRISGADLLEGGEVPKAYPPEERPFERPFRAWEPVVPLSLDPQLWTDWFRRFGGAAKSDTRYRRGHRWSLQDSLHELEHPLGTPRSRRLAHLELAVRSGFGLRFDQDAFVSAQRRQLDAWRARLTPSLVERTSGTWPRLG